MKNFKDHLEEWMTHFAEFFSDVSEDRRKWVRLQVANSFLFRAGYSFYYYQRNIYKNESALNEALALRNAAFQLYEDEYKRQKSDAEGVVRAFAPKPPIKIERKKKGRKVPPMVLKKQTELAERRKKENVHRKKVEPLLAGFLDGAQYDPIEIVAHEIDSERAATAALKAAEAIQRRLDQDGLLCSENWEEADLQDDEEECNRWLSEIYLVEEDQKNFDAWRKQHSLNES